MIYAILRINHCPGGVGKMVNIKNYEDNPLLVDSKKALEIVRAEYKEMYPESEIFMRYEEIKPIAINKSK